MLVVGSHRKARLPIGAAHRIPTTWSYQELGTCPRDARTSLIFTFRQRLWCEIDRDKLDDASHSSSRGPMWTFIGRAKADT